VAHDPRHYYKHASLKKGRENFPRKLIIPLEPPLLCILYKEEECRLGMDVIKSANVVYRGPDMTSREKHNYVLY
jgi:hypothetical protein